MHENLRTQDAREIEEQTRDTWRGEIKKNKRPRKFWIVVALCSFVGGSDWQFVNEGQPVTLAPGFTGLKEEDLIQCMFGNEEVLIAEMDLKTNRTSVFEDVFDGIFRDRLQMDRDGSLSITTTTVEHGGAYLFRTTDMNSTFILGVYEGNRVKHAKTGESVALSSGRREISKDDEIQWKFDDKTVAEIVEKNNIFIIHEDVLNNSYINRLRLDNKTGTLTIIDSRPEDTRLYHVYSNFFGLTFALFVYEEISATEGDSLSLRSDVWINQSFRWVFGDEDTLVAEMEDFGSVTVHDDVLNGTFRDRLKLNNRTGALTISDIRAEHAGNYRFYHYLQPWGAFHVSVHARPPVPVVTKDCSSSSRQICSLLCSVDVSDVTLSWFKGDTLISSINGSELRIDLSLPLEDQRNISCAVNSIQTSHVDVSQLCKLCAERLLCCDSAGTLTGLVLSVLVAVALVLVVAV
ncbi:hypothetical protein DNTS_026358 [Danionella cerebrum]|uniref:Ig-like domain-containing protein n=1 Tax=Danionella cerebrum TaxID=2873325 RepID=A0A553RCF7_9TELE|nr:hypothetical protein DNTS_026358 [Danionella translucida]